MFTCKYTILRTSNKVCKLIVEAIVTQSSIKASACGVEIDKEFANTNKKNNLLSEQSYAALEIPDTSNTLNSHYCSEQFLALFLSMSNQLKTPN
jgi:hypothetical protein